MIRLSPRCTVLRQLSSRPLFRRAFSVKAVYSSFPCTLFHYSSRQHSNLYDHKEANSRPDDLFSEGVIVDEKGLVYPSVNTQLTISNGSEMTPNTFSMQEFTRMYFDYFLEREDAGHPVETPFVYTIPKGTPIPNHLILINECRADFSLQPSHGMSLTDLNQSLDEFYRKHASKETAEAWFDEHPYQTAIADNADAIWMAM
ncbi:hypothetical protein F4779DRAFT_418088 [Xylariaceae sp. FL0662B]|nr:hypothetical protein F4779DRAFT_418088 [Xylariaceae sp. FL0662B]